MERNQIAIRASALGPVIKESSVLWIDDNPSNNEVPRKILEKAGIVFSFAASSNEAKRILASKQFDLIISDVGRDNPKDMNGIEFVKQEIKGNTPVILYTMGYNEDKLGLPKYVYAVAHRPDYLIHYVFDALERGGAPFPSGYQRYEIK